MSGPKPERDPVAEYLALKKGTAPDPVSDYLSARSVPPTPSVIPNTQGNYAKGLATSVGQGATMGFADEILGGIDAANSLLPKALGGEGGSLKNLGAKYRATRDLIRNTENSFAEENPKAHFAATVAGGLVDAPLFGGSAAKTLLGRVGQGVDAGIVGGATAGYGASAKPTFDEQMQDAARGGMGGAAIGAAIPLAGAATRSVGGKLLDVSGQRPTSYANTPTMGQQARRLFDPLLRDPSESLGAGAPPGPALPPQMRGSGVSPIASRRIMGPGTTPPQGGILQSTARAMGVQSVEDRALAKVQQAMDRDGLTLEQASQKAAGAFGMEPNTLMELAGRNMKRLGRSVLTAPGPGSDLMASTMEDRAKGEEETILGNLYGHSGLGGPTNVRQTVDQLVEQRSNEAQGNYGALRQAEPAVIPELRELSKRPSFRAAYARAEQIAAEEGTPMPPLFSKSKVEGLNLPSEFESAGERQPLEQPVFDEKGNPRALDFQTVDRIKRGLDDLSYRAERGGNVLAGQSATDAGGLGPEAIAKIKGTRAQFLKLADKAFPDYPAARSAFAGKTALADALEQGRKVFTTRPEDAQAYLSTLGNSEQEMFRRGAAEAFREKIEGVPSGNDITRRVFDKTTDAKRLALVFPNKADLQSFGERVGTAAQRFRTRNFLGAQSQTADKLAEVADLAGVSLQDVADLATGNAKGILRRTTAKFAGQSQQNLSEEMANQIAQRLTAGARPGTSIQDALNELRQAQRSQSARRSIFGKTLAGATAAGVSQVPPRRSQ